MFEVIRDDDNADRTAFWNATLCSSVLFSNEMAKQVVGRTGRIWICSQ
jgi:hypothetical protein